MVLMMMMTTTSDYEEKDLKWRWKVARIYKKLDCSGFGVLGCCNRYSRLTRRHATTGLVNVVRKLDARSLLVLPCLWWMKPFKSMSILFSFLCCRAHYRINVVLDLLSIICKCGIHLFNHNNPI